MFLKQSPDEIKGILNYLTGLTLVQLDFGPPTGCHPTLVRFGLNRWPTNIDGLIEFGCLFDFCKINLFCDNIPSRLPKLHQYEHNMRLIESHFNTYMPRNVIKQNFAKAIWVFFKKVVNQTPAKTLVWFNCCAKNLWSPNWWGSLQAKVNPAWWHFEHMKVQWEVFLCCCNCATWHFEQIYV